MVTVCRGRHGSRVIVQPRAAHPGHSVGSSYAAQTSRSFRKSERAQMFEARERHPNARSSHCRALGDSPIAVRTAHREFDLIRSSAYPEARGCNVRLRRRRAVVHRTGGPIHSEVHGARNRPEIGPRRHRRLSARSYEEDEARHHVRRCARREEDLHRSRPAAGAGLEADPGVTGAPEARRCGAGSAARGGQGRGARRRELPHGGAHRQPGQPGREPRQAGRGRGGCGDAGRRSDRGCRRRRRRPGRWRGRRRGRAGRVGRRWRGRRCRRRGRQGRARRTSSQGRQLPRRPVDDGVDAADEIEDVEDLDDDVDDTEESESDEAVAETEAADEPEEAESTVPPSPPSSRAAAASASSKSSGSSSSSSRARPAATRPGASQAVVVGLVVRRRANRTSNGSTRRTSSGSRSKATAGSGSRRGSAEAR